MAGVGRWLGKSVASGGRRIVSGGGRVVIRHLNTRGGAEGRGSLVGSVVDRWQVSLVAGLQVKAAEVRGLEHWRGDDGGEEG